ncbi:glycosyltransferase [Massilia timonae]|uniref:glycosyltransferase n=1 Tax=Massilia timonae TaxID=47229 RepID=UPI00289B6482|nr:glycosyltransferase [Massilia timonae]
MQGHVDRLRAGVLDGWAWNPSQPNEVVCIEVWDDKGKLIAVGVADQYRSDLLNAGIGNGAHGYSLRLPSNSLESTQLVVKILGEETELIGSPLLVKQVDTSPDVGQNANFCPHVHLKQLTALDESYAQSLIKVTQSLEQRRKSVTQELLRLNSRFPGVVNSVHNSASAHRTLPRRDILIFPPIDWDYRYQRPQQIANGLASLGHRVFYIAPSFINSESFAPGSIYDIPHPGVFLIKLRCRYPHPQINRNILSNVQRDDLSDSINCAISDLAIVSPVVIIQNPVWNAIHIKCGGTSKIYDCLDLISGFEATSPEMILAETELIRDADLLIASSPQLIDYLKAEKPDSSPALVRNATSEEFFTTKLPKLSVPYPTIGYLGAIENWFDTNLVKEIATLQPDWKIVLAGHPLSSIRLELEAFSNIIFLGEISARETPDLLASFDVAIIPFLTDGMTPFVNPVKVYEYLAAGRGVVACRMPELDQFEGFVLQADDAKDFCEKIVSILESNTYENGIARRMRVNGETWRTRALQISNLINIALPT